MSKLKIAAYILAAVVVFIIGVFVGKGLSKDQEQPQVLVQNDVKSNNLSKCVVTKKTDSNGQVTEVIEANAQSDSFLSSIIEISPEKGETIDLFLGAGLNTDLHFYGSLEIVFGKNALEFNSDFNKDHSVFYKRKVLEWQ